MKNWILPITWECYEKIEVGAETIEEAIKSALKFENEVGYELPEGDYVDSSFKIDDNIEIVKAMNS